MARKKGQYDPIAAFRGAFERNKAASDQAKNAQPAAEQGARDAADAAVQERQRVEADAGRRRELDTQFKSWMLRNVGAKALLEEFARQVDIPGAQLWKFDREYSWWAETWEEGGYDAQGHYEDVRRTHRLYGYALLAPDGNAKVRLDGRPSRWRAVPKYVERQIPAFRGVYVGFETFDSRPTNSFDAVALRQWSPHGTLFRSVIVGPENMHEFMEGQRQKEAQDFLGSARHTAVTTLAWLAANPQFLEVPIRNF